MLLDCNKFFRQRCDRHIILAVINIILAKYVLGKIIHNLNVNSVTSANINILFIRDFTQHNIHFSAVIIIIGIFNITQLNICNSLKRVHDKNVQPICALTSIIQTSF